MAGQRASIFLVATGYESCHCLRGQYPDEQSFGPVSGPGGAAGGWGIYIYICVFVCNDIYIYACNT